LTERKYQKKKKQKNNKLHMKFGRNLFNSVAAMHKKMQTTPMTLADNISMWLFSIGNGHMSQEIWLQSIQGFNRCAQTKCGQITLTPADQLSVN
jgi:hypothetical protein